MLDIVVGIVLVCVFGPFIWLCIVAMIEWIIIRIWNKDVAASVINWLFFAPIWVPLLVAVLAIAAWVISTMPPIFAYLLLSLFFLGIFAHQIEQ